MSYSALLELLMKLIVIHMLTMVVTLVIQSHSEYETPFQHLVMEDLNKPTGILNIEFSLQIQN